MLVPVAAPRLVLGAPGSPKSIVTSRITVFVPVAGATEAVNVTSVPAVGLVVTTLNETAGCGRLPTTTEVDADPVAPDESVAVAVTRYVPAAAYAYCRLATAPASVLCVPSPKST